MLSFLLILKLIQLYAEDIKAISSSKKAVNHCSVVAGNIVKQEPEDYFVKAIKDVGLEIKEPETIAV